MAHWLKRRTKMEDELRDGAIDALVCTSSLELGIDVGSIKRVLQVNSPRSVDRMLQELEEQIIESEEQVVDI